eukprot:CAMPEP_0176388094 /NCGR_PEP_ID=MMETSP0126-20121128/37291_1 /TAXON_ID=141414 ORGANISM="Strombidinopsis acuminatum, Strain SPMC142" /NCGR_SAMPLE_ID=MMETSP0126 /ASSEMBLY_ACC=CAM_ASM_000229 /LENGTH=37 /DNA_ID= /DNA_START= /DNA_END= /DNA_ORIENTATION=
MRDLTKVDLTGAYVRSQGPSSYNKDQFSGSSNKVETA